VAGLHSQTLSKPKESFLLAADLGDFADETRNRTAESATNNHYSQRLIEDRDSSNWPYEIIESAAKNAALFSLTVLTAARSADANARWFLGRTRSPSKKSL